MTRPIEISFRSFPRPPSHLPQHGTPATCPSDAVPLNFTAGSPGAVTQPRRDSSEAHVLAQANQAERLVWLERAPTYKYAYRSIVILSVSRKPCHIGRLPPELLAEVFHWHISSSFAKHNKMGSHHPCGWLLIRHVCSQWRSVALTYPILSSFICLTRPDCVRDLLARSGVVPLRIYDPFWMPSDPEATHECLRLVLRNFERVVFARFTLSRSMLEPQTDSTVLPIRVSLLRSLQFTVLYSPRTNAPLFPNFDFPWIEELSVQCASLAMVCHMVLPTLRRPELEVPPNDIFPAAFVSMLEPLQVLEELYLRGVCDGFRSALQATPCIAAAVSQKTVALPRLRHLSIKQTCADDGILAFCYINYPAIAHVSLRFDGVSQPHLYDFVFDVVRYKLEGHGVIGPAPIPRSLSLVSGFAFDSDYSRHLKLFLRYRYEFCPKDLVLWAARQPLDMISSTPQDSAAEQPYFHLSIASEHYQPWQPQLLARLPLDSVESALIAERVVSRAPLCAIGALRSLPNLEELKLEYEAFDSDTAGLAEPADGGGSLHALCPGIKVLQVHELHHSYSFQPPRRPSTLKPLAHALASRAPDSIQDQHLRLEYSRSHLHANEQACDWCSSSKSSMRRLYANGSSESSPRPMETYAGRLRRSLKLGGHP